MFCDSTPQAKNEVLLEMKNISKSYGATKALIDVSILLERGTVHALMGENGAGKSTLMKILAGIVKKDNGTILYKGKSVAFLTPNEARKNGISMIHQELSTLPEMKIYENIFLGREIYLKKYLPILDYKSMQEQSAKLLQTIGLSINPNKQMKQLTVSQMQMVEIAKAISVDAEIIIMDEPTSAITTREVSKLFEIIKNLRSQGRCIIYITHKMEEVFQISDLITVFRDGSYVGTYKSKDIDSEELIRHMVNRDLRDIYPKRNIEPGKTLLEVKKISRSKVFKNVSFKVKSGEIVGLAGLMGSGRTEIVESIFGITPITSGEILIDSKVVKIKTPKNAIAKGIGLVTEDRKLTGLVLNMSIANNITLPSIPKLSALKVVIRQKQLKNVAQKYSALLKTKANSIYQSTESLSGGNQQKIVLGKWLMMKPNILIFDEPTRGIDVGAKAEFYQIISDLATKGVAIIFISSEMPEIMGMCDRIIVMHNGMQSGELSSKEATQELLLQFATGLSNLKEQTI